jgi:hypothetical protein
MKSSRRHPDRLELFRGGSFGFVLGRIASTSTPDALGNFAIQRQQVFEFISSHRIAPGSILSH